MPTYPATYELLISEAHRAGSNLAATPAGWQTHEVTTNVYLPLLNGHTLRLPAQLAKTRAGRIALWVTETVAENLRKQNRTQSRLPAPVQTEARTVPFDDGPGPDNRKRIKSAREEAIETNEHQSVDGTEGLFLGGGSSQNNDLLPQR
jgi:hypothetical protein